MVCTKKNDVVKKYRLARKIAPNGNIWTTASYNSDLGSHSWQNIAYDGTKFVAISYGGYVSTSTNGTTWTTTTQNSTLGKKAWHGLAYGNDIFVALGLNGYISVSGNGTTWGTPYQNSTLGSNNWYGIAYGNGRFIAISNNYISTSFNGTTWSTPMDIGSINWRSIAYGNGRFVLINRGGKVVSLINGETWTPFVQSSELGNNYWYNITYGAGIFVAISESRYISTSTDGENWTQAVQVDYEGANGNYGLAYGDNKFVILSSTGYISINEGIQKTYTLATKKEDIREFVQPNLTANGTLGETKFAVSSPNNKSNLFKIFNNGNMETYSVYDSNSKPITFFNSNPLKVTAINIEKSNANAVISNVTVSASNDGLNWVQIYSGSHSYYYNINLINTEFYTYYKINFSELSTTLLIHNIEITATEQYTKSTRYI